MVMRYQDGGEELLRYKFTVSLENCSHYDNDKAVFN